MLGFRNNIQKVHEVDATLFLRALDAGLVTLIGNLYRAPRSGAGEQFFWEYSKGSKPMPFSVWIEPIITVGALATLHYEYDWPKQLLGTQSDRDWAFDVMTYIDPQFSKGYIACEVKKTASETDRLVEKMRDLGVSPDLDVHKRDRNAWKKVEALRSRRTPIFWALGPGGHGAVFEVTYSDDRRVTFDEVSHSSLRYPGVSGYGFHCR